MPSVDPTANPNRAVCPAARRGPVAQVKRTQGRNEEETFPITAEVDVRLRRKNRIARGTHEPEERRGVGSGAGRSH